MIQNKLGDLQKMGIPCAFVYVTTWTGVLYVSGDERIAEQLHLQSKPILDALDCKRAKTGEFIRNFCLPRLPTKIVANMLVGVGKDLKIQWKGDPPEWWPDSVPFQHPRDTAPDIFKGELLYTIAKAYNNY